MGTTTMGVKLDEATRDRIKAAAQQIDRTPHWVIKQAIFNYLERVESGSALPELPLPAADTISNDTEETITSQEQPLQPFLDLPSKFCRSRFHVQRSRRPIVDLKMKPFPCC